MCPLFLAEIQAFLCTVWELVSGVPDVMRSCTALLFFILAASSAAAQSADTLRAPIPDMQFFGWSVASDGERLVVGADENLESGARRGDPKGTAFVYRLTESGPEYEGRLESDRIGHQDCFGWQLAVRGDVAVASAECEWPGGDESGAVYVYRYDGAAWQREAKLVQSDVGGEVVPGVADWHYLRVALGSDVLAVGGRGVPSDDPDADERGAVYLFERTDAGWAWSHTLVGTDTDGSPSERFGATVAMTQRDGEDVLFVGAPFGASPPGLIHVFEPRESGWSERDRVSCEGLPVEGCGYEFHAGGGGGIVNRNPTGPSGAVIAPLDFDGEGWSLGTNVAPPGLSSFWGARFGDVILAMGWTEMIGFGLHVLTASEGIWTREWRSIPQGYYADVPLALAGDRVYVGIGYPGAGLSPGAVLMIPQGAVEVAEAEAPPMASPLALEAAPNPTGGAARLTFSTTQPGPARLVVVDALGRHVVTRDLGVLAPGAHEETVELGGVASGVYLVRVEAAGGTATARVVRR